jgi:hypothetical protein
MRAVENKTKINDGIVTTNKRNNEKIPLIYYKISNISVEFFKQVEILSRQPYFQPNFSYKTTSVANDFLSQPTSLPH